MAIGDGAVYGRWMMSDTVRLSYRALGDRLGISKEAAKSRVRRAGWERTVNEFGEAEFIVPLDTFKDKGKDYTQELSLTYLEKSEKELEVTSDALDVLRGVLKTLREEIESKDEEIARLKQRIPRDDF